VKCVYQTSADEPRQLQIRALCENDLEFADKVRASCGWNQTYIDWRRLIAHEPDGCFCALWDGERAGTVTTTSYGGDLAWIGMMLVDPKFRRRGISTGLMNQAIGSLRAKKIRCIKLDATPEGEPVYQKLGFRPEWRLQRWEAELPDGRTGSAGERQLDGLRDLDVEAFGADRSGWLGKLERDSRIVHVSESGYGMARDGMRANYLGPVVADEERVGVGLCRQLIGQLEGRTFWDIPVLNEPAEALANELGFKPTRTLLRMWLGEENVAGDPRLQFAIGEPATG